MEDPEISWTAWEQAYLKQCHDAAVGRLFRGIVHNLNGFLQVFSLQADLFAMSLGQAEAIMTQLLAGNPQAETGIMVNQLRDVLHRRSEALGQMQARLRSSEELIRRTLVLPDFIQNTGSEPYTMNSVVQTEMEFLSADVFFKHKVIKDLQLGQTLPPVRRGHLALHQIVFSLLENALDAVRGREDARITLQTAGSEEQGTMLRMQDNGPGVDPGLREKIFTPFHGTKVGHSGLGLYLARKQAGELGGSLVCEDGDQGASFRLTIPAAGAP